MLGITTKEQETIEMIYMEMHELKAEIERKIKLLNQKEMIYDLLIEKYPQFELNYHKFVK